MTLLLVLLAIAVLGVAAMFGVGRLRPGIPGAGVITDAQGLPEPDPRLPPVLLPEHPAAADVSRVRFSVAPRGYRMDQVDAVLERLAAALAERDARIARLEAAGPGAAPGGDGS